MVAINVHNRAHRFFMRGQCPGNKPNTIKSVNSLGQGGEPQKAIGRLRDGRHRSRQGAILGPPRLVHVLGEAQVRIEGVNRGCTERHIGQKNAQNDRKGVAGPVKAARNYLPHVGSRKNITYYGTRSKTTQTCCPELTSNGRERVLGLEADLVSVPTRMITFM